MTSAVDARQAEAVDTDRPDPAAERDALYTRLAIEVPDDGGAVFAMRAITGNSQLGPQADRALMALVDRIDEYELRLLDYAAREVQRREAP